MLTFSFFKTPSKMLLVLLTLACVLVSTALAWQVYAALMQAGTSGVAFAHVQISPINGTADKVESGFIRQQAALGRARAVLERVIDNPAIAEDLTVRAAPNASQMAPNQLRATLRSYVQNRLKIVTSRQPAQLTFYVRTRDGAFAARLSDAVAQGYVDFIGLGSAAKTEIVTLSQASEKSTPKTQFIVACALVLIIGLVLSVLVPIEMRSKTKKSKRRKFAVRKKGTSKMKPSKFEPYQEYLESTQPPVRQQTVAGETSIAESIIASSQPELVLFVDAAATSQVPSQQHTDLIDHMLAAAADLNALGKNTVIIDAAWSPDTQSTQTHGLSDLIEGTANFGEILHCDPDTGISYVPRGTGSLKMSAMPEIIDLRDAMTTLFDIVLVHIGDVQNASLLTTFVNARAQIVIVEPTIDGHSTGAEVWSESEQKFEEDLWLEAGFAAVHIVPNPNARTPHHRGAQKERPHMNQNQRHQRMVKPSRSRSDSVKNGGQRAVNSGRKRHG